MRKCIYFMYNFHRLIFHNLLKFREGTKHKKLKSYYFNIAFFKSGCSQKNGAESYSRVGVSPRSLPKIQHKKQKGKVQEKIGFKKLYFYMFILTIFHFMFIAKKIQKKRVDGYEVTYFNIQLQIIDYDCDIYSCLL